MVINAASWNKYHGHVAIVTSINPLKIIAMNDNDGPNCFTKNRELSSTSDYRKKLIGYIYYKLDKVNPPSNYIVINN